jgi:hypothetical protein
MSELSNKEFNDLLSSLVTKETFSLKLTDGNVYEFYQLSTNQLKELVKAVVDSPLTQSVFNNTLSRIMKESFVNRETSLTNFNVVDRLLFCLTTRIESLSPTYNVNQENRTLSINLAEIKEKLSAAIETNKVLFSNQQTTSGEVTLAYGLPLVPTETQLNDELYKNADINVDTPNELRKLLGEAFINEIAKTIKTITIQEKTLDLSTLTFKARLKTIESLPASVVQQAIGYVEKYKGVIDSCLRVSDDYSVSIDGSLFSLR